MIAFGGNRSVLLDANLLLVLAVGALDSSLIGRVKGTGEFAPIDYELLVGIVQKAVRLVVTPHVLTELDNLLGKLKDYERQACRQMVASWLASAKESQPLAVELVVDEFFQRLGLSDVGVARVAKRCVVWTNDHALYCALISRGALAFYYAHERAKVLRA